MSTLFLLQLVVPLVLVAGMGLAPPRAWLNAGMFLVLGVASAYGLVGALRSHSALPLAYFGGRLPVRGDRIESP